MTSSFFLIAGLNNIHKSSCLSITSLAVSYRPVDAVKTEEEMWLQLFWLNKELGARSHSVAMSHQECFAFVSVFVCVW